MLSTPNGRRGFFWNTWTEAGWAKFAVTGWMCERFPKALASLLHGDEVRVRRSAHKVRFLHPLGWSYYATLRRKLRWYEGVV